MRPSLPVSLPCAALCLLAAACTPQGFPDNPFERTEQALTAPAVQPLDTGFPGADDLARARADERDAFALSDQAAALSERSAGLAGRDPARSGDQRAPAAPADQVLARGDSLRARAEALRARDDVGQKEAVETLSQERETLGTDAEILRSRTD